MNESLRPASPRIPGTSAARPRLLPVSKELPIRVDVRTKGHKKNLTFTVRKRSCPHVAPRLEANLGALDTSLMVVPFLVILVMGMFGLDERAASPRRPAKTRRFFCEVDGKGRMFLSDPDGTPWQKKAVRQIDARLVQTGPDGRMESLIRLRRT